MENSGKENKPYIRLSEIPAKHKVFTDENKPCDADGESEPCYDKVTYEKWYERWEGEGGQNVEED